MLTQTSCIFTQSASQKMHFQICNASLVCMYNIETYSHKSSFMGLLVTPNQLDHRVPGLKARITFSAIPDKDRNIKLLVLSLTVLLGGLKEPTHLSIRVG